MGWKSRRYGSSKRYSSKPKRRGLTAAQQAAHDKAYAACDHTIEGNFSKGDVVAEYDGTCWKIVTYGIRYHEDVTSCIYGVQPTRGPKGAAETREIRAAIERVLKDGMHTPDSGGGGSERAERPEGAELAAWTDARYQSMATFPTIRLYEGGIIGVVRPIYDDSPCIAWMRDEKLERRLWRAINACPKAVTLPQVTVKRRFVNLTIDKGSPRYAAYAAAKDVEVVEATDYGIKAGLKLPRSEYRRIKAELDAANIPTE